MRARRLLNRSAPSFSKSSPRLKNRANPSKNTTKPEYQSKTNPPPRAHENEGAQVFSSRGRSIPLGHSLADLSSPPPAFSAHPAFRLSDLRTLPPGQPPHRAGIKYRFTFPKTGRNPFTPRTVSIQLSMKKQRTPEPYTNNPRTHRSVKTPPPTEPDLTRPRAQHSWCETQNVNIEQYPSNLTRMRGFRVSYQLARIIQ
jgi:hypothetical protein